MTHRTLATLLMTLSLCACSSAPEPDANLRLDAAACCEQRQQLPLTALAVPFQQKLVMDNRLPTLPAQQLLESESVDATPAPVMSYQITADESFSLLLRAYIEHDRLFAPLVVLYNADWQPIASVSSDRFDYQPSGLGGLERIEATLTLNPGQDGARYLLISADQQALQRVLPRRHMQEMYAESQQIIGHKQKPLTAEFAPFGRIELTASQSTRHEVLTLLSELGIPAQQAPHNTRPIADANKQWPDYQHKIDDALQQGNIKLAAEIANQAAELGMTQAKDYLVQQLAD